MRVSGNRRTRGGGRQGSNTGRSASSGGRQGSNRRASNSNRSYDSNGPEGKIRGTAAQVSEKYTALARDAQTSGDHVAAENFWQHAEHYIRILAVNNAARQERQEQTGSDEQFTYDGNANAPRETSQGVAAPVAGTDKEKEMSGRQPDIEADGIPATDEDGPAAKKTAKPRKPRQPRRPRTETDNKDVEATAESVETSEQPVPSE